jgi:very-short-patch-repair endonuclease/predicted transcriptional regulator of viral defense system
MHPDNQVSSHGTEGGFPAPLRYAAADRAILSIASRQHGVVTRAQLAAAGIPMGVVERRLALKKLRRLYRGVYLAAPIESAHARTLAAVLACGALTDDGFLATTTVGEAHAVGSHWSALRLFGLARSGLDPASSVNVTVAGRDPRRPGIRIHRVPSLPPNEITMVDGVPVTTAARTLLDLSGGLSARDLERLVIEALGSRLTTKAELVELLARYPHRRGAATLRMVLGADNPGLARSEAERLFRTFVREGGLPEPEVNVVIGGFEVDFLWRDQRLIVEVDGAAYHSTSDRFETDRRRDRTLVAAGYRVIRVTWWQIKHERIALAVQLARALCDTTADGAALTVSHSTTPDTVAQEPNTGGIARTRPVVNSIV